MPVTYRVLAGRELDPGLAAAWDGIRRGAAAFASPFLAPAFTAAAAAARDDVFVTVIEDGGRPVGFFPHQRRGTRAVPVAGMLNDCQAVVAAPGAEWSPAELLRGSGLTLWDFDHLRCEQTLFRPFARHEETSPVIGLEDGFETFLERSRASGSRRLAQFARKRRKLEREQGGAAAIRFEPLSASSAALDRVIAWKLEQCARTGTHPYFREPWTVELVRRLMASEDPGCAGALSVLWIGDRVAAAHFGIRSETVWHWWFPTYDHGWSAYSPGALMLMDLCAHVGGPEAAQRTIDLGKGDDAYKASFANGGYRLWEGHVARGSLYAPLRQRARAARAWARGTPILAPLRRLRRALRGQPPAQPPA